jgi:hypothetical protein
LQALVYRYIGRFVLSTRCFLRVLGVLLRSGSWFRLRPEGGLGGLDVPNSANVPVGGLPTFILDFGYVAVLQTAGVMRGRSRLPSTCSGSGSARKSASPFVGLSALNRVWLEPVI